MGRDKKKKVVIPIRVKTTVQFRSVCVRCGFLLPHSQYTCNLLRAMKRNTK